MERAHERSRSNAEDRRHPAQFLDLLQDQVVAASSGGALFWAGPAAARTRTIDTAVARVRRAIAMQLGWEVLLERLPTEVAPSARSVLRALRDYA